MGEINQNQWFNSNLVHENKVLQDKNKFLKDTIAQYEVSQKVLERKFKTKIHEYETELDSTNQSKNSLETQNKSLLEDIQYLEINNKSL